MAMPDVQFKTSTGRYVPHEFYESGGVKTYRDSATGQLITRNQYQKLKKSGAIDNPVGIASAPVADVEDAPQPVVRVAEKLGGLMEEKSPARDKKGLAEAIMPGLLLLGTGLIGIARPFESQFVPPADMLEPAFTPFARVWDRHAPLKLKLEETEDGKDILEGLGGMAVCAAYVSEQIKQYREWRDSQPEEEDDVEQQVNHGRRGRRGDSQADGLARTATDETSMALGYYGGANGATRQGAGQNGSRPRERGSRNDQTDGRVDASLGNPDISRQAASIARLRDLDAQGRALRGLG